VLIKCRALRVRVGRIEMVSYLFEVEAGV
jgi:hypothetical protein